MVSELSSLPAKVKLRLDELTSVLQQLLGDDLASIVVYGSAARGGYRPEESDVDVMVVIHRDPEEKMAAIGPSLQLARYSARIEVMILRQDEIGRATDCFPLLYDDIARRSIVLFGQSPFIGLTISEEHKRLRIEQELREARIRIRRVAADMAREPSYGPAVERKAKQVRGALWALLALRGIDVDDGMESVFARAGSLYRVEVAPILRAREEARPAYLALTTLLDAALADVDQEGPRLASGGAP